MQSDNCPERSRTLRAIERRVQNQVAIRNIDLLRCGGRLRTGEGADENKGQDAVSHGFAALASIWRPAVKLSRRVAAAQGSQDHKLVVRPGSRPCDARVIIFWLPETHLHGRSSAQIACTEVAVLNRTDRPAPMPGEADVKYLDGDFRVVRPGTFVRCAVTGVSIPLEELRYWSVDLQEAYATPEAVLQRMGSRYGP